MNSKHGIQQHSNYHQIDDDEYDNDIRAKNRTKSQPSQAPAPIIPSLFLIHGALILAQTLFGGGAIIGKLGLPSTNPVLFALIREGIAGPMLCVIAYIKDKQLPQCKHLKYFIMPGICLFMNQLCYIIGLKISSSITASAWQPSQGILAVLYGFCIGIEREFDRYKICGIIIGTAGAMFMILFDNKDNSGNDDIWSTFGGSFMFFLNCSGTVWYLILARPILKKYPSSTITGYSYIFASIMMVFTALIVANVPSLLNGVCPDCDGNAWNVPTETIYALIYWILGESVLAYLLITWANNYAPPSVNLAYTVLQPLTSAVLAEVLLVFGHAECDSNKSASENPSNCIYGPSYNDLGAIAIAIGLYLVIYSSILQKRKEERRNQGIDFLNDPSSIVPAVVGQDSF